MICLTAAKHETYDLKKNTILSQTLSQLAILASRFMLANELASVTSKVGFYYQIVTRYHILNYFSSHQNLSKKKNYNNQIFFSILAMLAR